MRLLIEGMFKHAVEFADFCARSRIVQTAADIQERAFCTGEHFEELLALIGAKVRLLIVFQAESINVDCLVLTHLSLQRRTGSQ